MDIWKKITTKIIKQVIDTPTNSIEEETKKVAILMYLYKSLESEEIFNNNCEILNEVNYNEIRLKRFGK